MRFKLLKFWSKKRHSYLTSVQDYYDKAAKQFGNSIDAVGWFSTDSQVIRFRQFLELGDLSNSTVLDVGSGLGDFFDFISFQSPSQYLGIDVSSQMIKLASKRYPSATFLHTDIFNLSDARRFDYVISSGIYSLKHDRPLDFLAMHLHQCWQRATKGIGFNLLSATTDKENQDPTFHYYHIRPVLNLCQTLSQSVVLIDDYLPNDFTVLLTKSS